MNETSESSDSIFKTVTTDIERLFVKPEKNDTTRIALLLSKCIIPISMDILKLPGIILNEIKKSASESEELLPIEAIDVYKLAYKIEKRILDKTLFAKSDDIIDIFIYDSVKSSIELNLGFSRALTKFCNEITMIQEQVSSEKSFYMSQTLGTDLAVDPTLVLTSVQNFIQKMNVSAAGLKGYKILALVKVINEIGEILNNDKIIKFYGVSNKTALVNKLGYRILPSQLSLNNQINELIGFIIDIEKSNNYKKESLAKLFTLAGFVKKGLDSTVFPKHKATEKMHDPVKENLNPLKSEKKGTDFIKDDKFDRTLIGKNVFIKALPGESQSTSGVGQVVDILPADVVVPDNKINIYFSELESDSSLTEKKISSDRIVIKNESGVYFVTVNDKYFKDKIVIV